jgi:hypothetical protein
MGHVSSHAGSRVDNHQINTISAGCVQNSTQFRRLGLHQSGRLRLPGAPPRGGTALWIKVDQERALSALLRQHGEVDGKRRFSDPPLRLSRPNTFIDACLHNRAYA